jgi:predicted lipoprotein with Yx(FWY)xxD motif
MKKLLLVSVVVLSLVISLGAYAATAVAAPPNVDQPQSSAMLKSASSAQGNILTDGNGFTLYTFSDDTAGKSTYSGTDWLPFIVSSGVQPQADSSVTGKLDVITRDDGKMQVTLDGKPLYYYAQDNKAGDINGNGIGGKWAVVMIGSSAAPAGGNNLPAQGGGNMPSSGGGQYPPANGGGQ